LRQIGGRGLIVLVAGIGVGIVLSKRHHRSHAQSEPVKPAHAVPQPLERLTVEKLYDAYSGGAASADPVYRGKRFTIVGNVAAVRADAGPSQVVLGSDLQPVIATGLAAGSASALTKGQPIEADCTVSGAVMAMPTIDCGPEGVPRPVSPAP
jgi:tRNA_anti-like